MKKSFKHYGGRLALIEKFNPMKVLQRVEANLKKILIWFILEKNTTCTKFELNHREQSKNEREYLKY